MRVSAAVVMQLHRDGYSDQRIADQTGANLADVTAIIDTHKALVARGDIPQPEAPTAVPNAVALLAWGTNHSAAAVRQYAERALTALEALQTRYTHESELLRVTSQADELQQQLDELRAREAELKGKGRAKPRTAAARDYTPAEVRAWAQQAGVECAPVGLVPQSVVEQWRAATGRTTQ
ncbi:Lsr2 dimerization domain-containing protein [Streptomyces erythrochromogenes]|uniref:Lsr2 dimerization domain-containing protein n=1 Tax=Streptomyces erythrochromogenes TaxID=285574 RepID=UPI0036AA2E75